MGATKINLKAAVQRLSIAIASSASLAMAAHAQLLTSGIDTGINPSSNLSATPGDHAPPLLTYGADVGIGETDNVTLVPTNKVSQTIATADVDFAVREQSRLLDVNAVGDFSDLDYLQNAYGNQLIGRFDGQGQIAIIPDRLTWVLRDDFGDATVDAFTPVTPNNLQYVNFVSTGPNLYLRLGGTGFINATARYSEADYETSPFNSSRALATLSAGLQLSAASSVSLNGGTERVMFQNTELNTDFDRTSVYGRYEAHGARTDLGVNLGATTIDEQGRSTTGGLGRLDLSRQLSPAARLNFTAGRELTDASSSFSTQQGGAIGLITIAPTPLTSNSYLSTYASLGWQYVRNRTTFGLTAHWERDRYPGAQQYDLTSEGGELLITRQLTPAFSAQLMGRLYKMDYIHASVIPNFGSPEYEQGLVGAALAWRQGRWLEIKLRYDHDSYTVATGDTGYRANRLFLTVGYRPTQATPVPVQ
jgi:hypothetical protein